MYLYEIYDASDDSLHEEARMLEACQNSGDEDRVSEFLAAIRDELHERTSTFEISDAVGALFSELELEHPGMLEAALEPSPAAPAVNNHAHLHTTQPPAPCLPAHQSSAPSPADECGSSAKVHQDSRDSASGEGKPQHPQEPAELPEMTASDDRHTECVLEAARLAFRHEKIQVARAKRAIGQVAQPPHEPPQRSRRVTHDIAVTQPRRSLRSPTLQHVATGGSPQPPTSSSSHPQNASAAAEASCPSAAAPASCAGHGGSETHHTLPCSRGVPHDQRASGGAQLRRQNTVPGQDESRSRSRQYAVSPSGTAAAADTAGSAPEQTAAPAAFELVLASKAADPREASAPHACCSATLAVAAQPAELAATSTSSNLPQGSGKSRDLAACADQAARSEPGSKGNGGERLMGQSSASAAAEDNAGVASSYGNAHDSEGGVAPQAPDLAPQSSGISEQVLVAEDSYEEEDEGGKGLDADTRGATCDGSRAPRGEGEWRTQGGGSKVVLGTGAALAIDRWSDWDMNGTADNAADDVAVGWSAEPHAPVRKQRRQLAISTLRQLPPPAVPPAAMHAVAASARDEASGLCSTAVLAQPSAGSSGMLSRDDRTASAESESTAEEHTTTSKGGSCSSDTQAAAVEGSAPGSGPLHAKGTPDAWARSQHKDGCSSGSASATSQASASERSDPPTEAIGRQGMEGEAGSSTGTAPCAQAAAARSQGQRAFAREEVCSRQAGEAAVSWQGSAYTPLSLRLEDILRPSAVVEPARSDPGLGDVSQSERRSGKSASSSGSSGQPSAKHARSAQGQGAEQGQQVRPSRGAQSAQGIAAQRDAAAVAAVEGRRGGGCASRPESVQQHARPPTQPLQMRSLIPVLPPLYAAAFPSFDSIIAFYWHHAHPSPPLVPRRDRPLQYNALLAEHVNTLIARCAHWFTRHPEHCPAAAVHPENSATPSRDATPNISKPSTPAIPNNAKPAAITHLSNRSASNGAAAWPPDTTSHAAQASQAARNSAGGGARASGGRASAVPGVAVPGWAPQLPTRDVANQRFFRVVTCRQHPEVAQVVRAAMTQLRWTEDPEGSAVVDASDDEADGAPCVRTPSAQSAAATLRTGSAGGSRVAEGAMGQQGGGAMCHMWNLMWTWSARVRVPTGELLSWQRVNHFQEGRQLTRKDLLKRHLQRHQAMFAASRHAAFFDCMPTTFDLPREFAAFGAAFAQVAVPTGTIDAGQDAETVQPRQKRGLNVWILKPTCLSRGRGIYLVDDLTDVACSQPSVIQRYIADPLLIHGHKFDLRLYVLVTSFNPLEAFVYKEGFARFAVQKYTNAPQQLNNKLVHLTNSSIQQERQANSFLPDFLLPSLTQAHGDTKTSFAHLWKLLAEKGISRGQLWEPICQTVLAAFYSAQDAIPNQVNSFELYGVDVMLDNDLKVWLIEVNTSPSLGLSTPLDEEIKGNLICDVIRVVDPLPFDRVALHAITVRRKQKNAGPDRMSRRHGGGLFAGTAAEDRELVNTDLHAVIKGRVPRQVDETPEFLGDFERLAPCPLIDQLARMKK